MFAGNDTTASSLTWILYALAKSPQHQRKVQEELDEVFQEKDKDVIEWYVTLDLKVVWFVFQPLIFTDKADNYIFWLEEYNFVIL